MRGDLYNVKIALGKHSGTKGFCVCHRIDMNTDMNHL